MTDAIAIGGALARRPNVGGHAWVLLQYILGFRRMGFDVLFLDAIEPEACVDASGRACAFEDSINLRYFTDVTTAFGLETSSMLSCRDAVAGLNREETKARLRHCEYFINVNGYITDLELSSLPGRRVYLDIDPGYPHMWHALGLSDPFAGHEDFVTIGMNLGSPSCPIPLCGKEWLMTPQPVVMDEWPVVEPPLDGEFTSIATWRGEYGPIDYQGRTYGLRVHEFRRYLALPLLTGESFALALKIDAADTADIEALHSNGWALDEPTSVAATPRAYRSFIQSSRAEIMISRSMYVDTNSGWFSDRSACYLATGRPVLARETGFTEWLPAGTGLLSFTTLDEAVEGVHAIASDYARHSAMAREIAEAYFDSDRVLPSLLTKLAESRRVRARA